MDRNKGNKKGVIQKMSITKGFLKSQKKLLKEKQMIALNNSVHKAILFKKSYNLVRNVQFM
jgi:hypothetical protein